MGDRDERTERIREEIAPQTDDPIEEGVAEEEEGLLIGKVDAIAERAARMYTADSQPRVHEGWGVARAHQAAVPETGVGVTLELDGDAERGLRPGEEVVVRLPDDTPEGWIYNVDGDERAIDIEERAEIVVHAGEHRHLPASGRRWQFVVHAQRKGRVTVRFERLGGDPAGDSGPIRLRLRIG
jgi:hypothetical protein